MYSSLRFHRKGYFLTGISVCFALVVLIQPSHAIEPLAEELVNILGTKLDLNSDGKPDVFYEYEIDSLPGYFELIDRNFDGRVDESTFYSEDHASQYGRADNNYDGLMDAVLEYENSYLQTTWADSDNNRIIDTVVEYRYGEISTARRYYPEGPTRRQAVVGVVTFDASYPSKEQVTPTMLTEEEFQTSLQLPVKLWAE